MSQYRCPLFGQGNENDLESPAGGIANSHKELFPELSDDLGGYYPLAVPRDQMAEYPADFTIASAAKWFWRVKTWQCTMRWISGVYALEQTFPMPGTKEIDDTVYANEDELNSPLDLVNAHYRQWDGSSGLFTSNGLPLNVLSATLTIGSHRAGGAVATLNELFRERTDGTFAPRVYIHGFVQVDQGDDQVSWELTNVGDGDYPSTLTLDGELLPDTLYTHAFGGELAQTMSMEFTPTEFWSWNGLWNTTTGAALSNPRV